MTNLTLHKYMKLFSEILEEFGSNLIMDINLAKLKPAWEGWWAFDYEVHTFTVKMLKIEQSGSTDFAQ